MIEEILLLTSEVIDGINSWNLAKDVNLLRYLETFSKELINSANQISQKLDHLEDNLHQTNTTYNVVQNRFHSLRNTQFIESRVYEEDEILHSNDYHKKDTSQNKFGEEKLKTMQTVIMRGTETINKYFEKVEILGSDSEDDMNFPSFTLQPKDYYSEKPLPYVIGTEYWHKKWHVGLLESSSESEEENQSRKNSISDSEDMLPIYRPKVLEETTSEADLNKSQSVLKMDTKNSYTSAEENYENNLSLPQVPKLDETFVEQLSAKLEDVFDINIATVNNRPIQKPSSGNIFFDEPPPLENEDIPDYEKAGNNESLFDDLDNDENSIWGKKVDEKAYNSNDFEGKKEVQNMISEKDAILTKGIQHFVEDEDHSIFNTKLISQIKKQTFPVREETLPFLSEEPPETPFTNKKTVGVHTPRDKNYSDKMKYELEEEKQNQKFKVDITAHKTPQNSSNLEDITTIQQEPKQLKELDDIFSDATIDLLNENLFSVIDSGNFSSHLFKSISDNGNPNITDMDKTAQKNNSNENKIIEKEGTRKITHSYNVDDVISESIKVAISPNLFEDYNDDYDDLFSMNLPDSDVKEDIVPSTDSTQNENNQKVFSTDTLNVLETARSTDEVLTISEINAFSNIPPDISDDGDVSSENNTYEDIFERLPEINSNKLNFFDNDPPSLFSNELNKSQNENERQHSEVNTSEQDENSFSEQGKLSTSSCIVPEGNLQEQILASTENEETVENKSDFSEIYPRKLKHTLDINVNALLPATRIVTSKITRTENNQQGKEMKEKLEAEMRFSFENSEDVKVLESITKNRVRAPITRRPSTRKGRQESLQKSNRNSELDVSNLHLEKNDVNNFQVSFLPDNNNFKKEPLIDQEFYDNKNSSVESIASSNKNTNESIKHEFSDSIFESKTVNHNYISEKKVITAAKGRILPAIIESDGAPKSHSTLFDSSSSDSESDIFSVKNSSFTSKKYELQNENQRNNNHPYYSNDFSEDNKNTFNVKNKNENIDTTTLNTSVFSEEDDFLFNFKSPRKTFPDDSENSEDEDLFRSKPFKSKERKKPDCNDANEQRKIQSLRSNIKNIGSFSAPALDDPLKILSENEALNSK